MDNKTAIQALGKMCNLPQWFVWRLTWNAEKEKYGKVPCYPNGSDAPMNAQDPANWQTFAQAQQALAGLSTGDQIRKYTLGFCFTADCGYWFIDIDDCITGGIRNLIAQWVIDRLPGAAIEISSSGRGLHIFGRGNVPEHAKKSPTHPGLEFYTEKRGVAFGLTGEFSGNADTDHTAALNAHVIPQLFKTAPPPPTVATIAASGPRADWRGPTDDDELLRRARRSVSGESVFSGKASFADLFDGNLSASQRAYYDNDASRMDAALASHLAYWTGCDVDRMVRLMRRSKLARDKWDSHKTYLREFTIHKACDQQETVYQEKAPDTVCASSIPNGQTAISHTAVVELLRGDEVTIEPIRWLWDGWLAAGKMHILAGAPGTGKTTIAMSLAATVTQGGRWPDGTPCQPGSVLVWSGEDDPGDTLAPRLMAAGADMSKVHFVNGVMERGERRSFDPATDIEALLAAVASVKDARLLVIDPIVSAVGGDSHKNTEVRRALQPLVDLAAELDIALLGITHFSKGTASRDPTERVTGSIAFAALARIVLVTAKGEGENETILARSKSNIGPDHGGFAYQFVQTGLVQHPGVSASSIQWGGAVEGSARELLGTAEAMGAEGANSGIDDLLTGALATGPMKSKDLKRMAESNGFSYDKLKRAKKRLGIADRQEGFGKDICVWWFNPNTPMQRTEST